MAVDRPLRRPRGHRLQEDELVEFGTRVGQLSRLLADEPRGAGTAPGGALSAELRPRRRRGDRARVYVWGDG